MSDNTRMGQLYALADLYHQSCENLISNYQMCKANNNGNPQACLRENLAMDKCFERLYVFCVVMCCNVLVLLVTISHSIEMIYSRNNRAFIYFTTHIPIHSLNIVHLTYFSAIPYAQHHHSQKTTSPRSSIHCDISTLFAPH